MIRSLSGFAPVNLRNIFFLGYCSRFLTTLWFGLRRTTGSARPGRVFRKYTLLGDDIVIGDPKVASVYREMMADLGVKISLPLRG